MIYGYVAKIVDDEYGLSEMRKVSVSTSPSVLRELAKFIIDAVAEFEEAGPVSRSWHRHVPGALARELGCDLAVCPKSAEPGGGLPSPIGP